MATPTSDRPTGRVSSRAADVVPGRDDVAITTTATGSGQGSGAAAPNGRPVAASREQTAPPPAPAPRAQPIPSPEATPARPPHAHGPGHAGRHEPDPATLGRPRQAGSKARRLLLLVPILLIALGVGTLLGYRYWYETTYFVTTDNASITGDLVQVGSLNAGRIIATRVDVGRPVREGQEIAVVAMPQEVSSGATGAAPKMSITGTTDALVPVLSPLTGVVAARMGYVGGTVAAGQPIYSLIDPKQVWVKANIEEANAWRVQVGQSVEVHVDALNRTFWGQVDAITPASAATFSLLPTGNTSGNFTKVTQYVPVKILVDAGGATLPLGTSVSVRIVVREPSSELPLPWQP